MCHSFIIHRTRTFYSEDIFCDATAGPQIRYGDYLYLGSLLGTSPAPQLDEVSDEKVFLFSFALSLVTDIHLMWWQSG